MLPDITLLRINGDSHKQQTLNSAGIPLPEDIEDPGGNRYMQKLKEYARSIPYAIESHSEALELLNFFVLRLTQSVDAKDFDIGFMQWDSMLT